MKIRRTYFCASSAFTMVEIAISLAIIGIALVAILGVLPIGMRSQRDNRERSLINQDATVFMEDIRNGVYSRFETDLTNYVFAITNAWTLYNPDGSVNTTNMDGYSYQNSQITSINPMPYFPLTNNVRIIGLMSMPEFTDINGNPLPALMNGLSCYSNHVVAYVRSISGSAIEKPPQQNAILLQNTFGYRIFCENLPAPAFLPSAYQSSLTYNLGDKVWTTNANGSVIYWQSQAGTNTDTPGQSVLWTRDGYTQSMMENSHELRLTFLWPLLPNSGLPPAPTLQTYRATIAGQLVGVLDTNATPNVNLYFFQPQNFATNAP